MRTFKTTIRVLLLSVMLAPALMLTSCATTDDGSYVEPISLYEKVSGKWVLNSMTQTDESNATTLDLTSVLDFNTFKVNIETDSQNKPTTFAIEGTAPQLLPLTGTWDLDSPYTHSDNTASSILLTSSDGNKKLTITGVPGASPTLEFRLTRTVNGKAYTSYTYNLSPTITE